MRIHGALSQKAVSFIFAEVRTWNWQAYSIAADSPTSVLKLDDVARVWSVVSHRFKNVVTPETRMWYEDHWQWEDTDVEEARIAGSLVKVWTGCPPYKSLISRLTCTPNVPCSLTRILKHLRTVHSSRWPLYDCRLQKTLYQDNFNHVIQE
jgi:hypothetical protein